MRRLHKRIVVVGAALLLVVLLGATAWSYFRAGGNGTGAATTGSATQPVTLSAGVPSSQVFPGAQAAVEITANNPNPVALRIESLSLDVSQAQSGFAVDAGRAACGVSSLSFTTQSNGGNGWTVPANGSTTISLPSALAMDVGAADACQGAAITVYLRAGVS